MKNITGLQPRNKSYVYRALESTQQHTNVPAYRPTALALCVHTDNTAFRWTVWHTHAYTQ